MKLHPGIQKTSVIAFQNPECLCHIMIKPGFLRNRFHGRIDNFFHCSINHGNCHSCCNCLRTPDSITEMAQLRLYFCIFLGFFNISGTENSNRPDSHRRSITLMKGVKFSGQRRHDSPSQIIGSLYLTGAASLIFILCYNMLHPGLYTFLCCQFSITSNDGVRC